MEVPHMLLEFRARNYKSFKDDLVFSMLPAPKQKGLDYSVLRQKIGSKTHKALCSAVLYGPNASGKTNIISAMDTFKNIVLRGNIRNSDDRKSPNDAAGNLELIPNNMSQEQLPLSFSVKFIENGALVDYALEADIGPFLDPDYKREIIFEQLKINGKTIFTREDGLAFESMDTIKRYLNGAYMANKESAESLAVGSLDTEELFLTSGFKVVFSAKLASLITDWLDGKFMVVFHANTVKSVRRFADIPKNSFVVDKLRTEAARIFGVTSNEIGYIADEGDTSVRLFTFFKRSGKKQGVLIPAEIYESYGTVRFINIFPLIATAIVTGGTLIVDEFDASIHPSALMSIINIFHNDEININKAQLIFNTHNPIFLNSNLFRRDEIKFTERDEETGYSTHYSLSDFGTSGKNGVRKNEDYLKNYFVSQYGAIKDIDFTPLFERLIEERKEV
jgi:AAA15 family ATPase/GTPase